jgi:hypothetical protein
MIVAVAADFELPPQQSDMFGHRASSQTVWRFRPRRSFLIFLYDELLGMGVLSHDGSRVISFCLPLGPTRAVFNAYFSDGSSGGSLPPTKSEKEGPAFSLSANEVGRTRGLEVGDSVAEGSGAAVAKARIGVVEVGEEGRKTRKGDTYDVPFKQRSFEAEAVILTIVMQKMGWVGWREIWRGGTSLLSTS